MTFEELEQWEAEIKVTSLINPIIFNNKDLVALDELPIEEVSPRQRRVQIINVTFSLEVPIIKKTIAWFICYDSKNAVDTADRYGMEEIPLYTFFEHIRKIHDTNVFLTSAANRKYEYLIQEYYKYKSNLKVDTNNVQLAQWFNTSRKTKES